MGVVLFRQALIVIVIMIVEKIELVEKGWTFREGEIPFAE
jgi:hypothetical protein